MNKVQSNYWIKYKVANYWIKYKVIIEYKVTTKCIVIIKYEVTKCKVTIKYKL